MEDIIKIDGLYKSYGKVKAVQDLSFRVKKGVVRLSRFKRRRQKHHHIDFVRSIEKGWGQG